MSEKRSFNPLVLAVGVVAGMVGALVLSEKKPNVTKSVLTRIKKTLADWEALSKQSQIDKVKTKIAKPKKK